MQGFSLAPYPLQGASNTASVRQEASSGRCHDVPDHQVGSTVQTAVPLLFPAMIPMAPVPVYPASRTATKVGVGGQHGSFQGAP